MAAAGVNELRQGSLGVRNYHVDCQWRCCIRNDMRRAAIIAGLPSAAGPLRVQDAKLAHVLAAAGVDELRQIAASCKLHHDRQVVLRGEHLQQLHNVGVAPHLQGHDTRQHIVYKLPQESMKRHNNRLLVMANRAAADQRCTSAGWRERLRASQAQHAAPRGRTMRWLSSSRVRCCASKDCAPGPLGTSLTATGCPVRMSSAFCTKPEVPLRQQKHEKLSGKLRLSRLGMLHVSPVSHAACAQGVCPSSA